MSHGLSDLSLRPLAHAIGSSPRVLLYLFGSKDGLIRALLARARLDELALIDSFDPGREGQPDRLAAVATEVWTWLAAGERRPLLTSWLEGYARSLADQDGPWRDFAHATVVDWMALLASAQGPASMAPSAKTERTVVLAVLRGGLMDLLATGETDRVTRAVLTAVGQV